MIDLDLEFLSECSNEQLKTLVDILVFNKDGEKRLTESLSNTQAFHECYPNNLAPLVPAIIDEFQRYGGNTFANLLRGHGVTYRVILEDVCDRLKVNYNKGLPTELLEAELLKKAAISVIEKMSEEDIKNFNSSLDKTTMLKAIINGTGAMPLVMATVAAMISRFGLQVGKKQAAMLFGRVLAPRMVAFAVPVINVLAVVWTAFDIASPAYRVTVPFTLTVAFLRRQNCGSDESKLFEEIFA